MEIVSFFYTLLFGVHRNWILIQFFFQIPLNKNGDLLC